MEEAEQVYQDMLAADVRPSTAVFNNLIAGLSRSGHAQSAFKYFNDVSLQGYGNGGMGEWECIRAWEWVYRVWEGAYKLQHL